MTAPIERHRNLRYLLREFMTRSDSGAFRPFSSELLETLLGPPASIARWIVQFHPELREKASLHVVIMGAAEQDGIDSGSWYGLMPWMLGNADQKISVTLVGPQLFSDSTGDYGAPRKNRGRTLVSPAGPAATRLLPPASLVPASIGDFLGSDVGREPIDLFFAFNPGIEDEDAWLTQGNLDAVCSRGVPIGVASYCDQERVTEREVLETGGFRVADKHEHNPFGGEQTPVGQWAGSFWELLPVAPSPGFVADPHRQQALLDHFEHASDFLRAHGRTPFEEAGMVVSLKLPGEAAPRNVIRLLTPYIAVDRDSGELILFNEEGHVEGLGEAFPEEMMAQYPKGEFSFPHLRWAFEAYEMSVLSDEESFDPDFGEDLAPEDGPGLMESMLRTLGQQARQRQRQAPPGSEAAEDGRLFPMDYEDVMAGMANVLRTATGRDVDPATFMQEMRAAGGMHGPTHEAWLNIFSHLGWAVTELTNEPRRLQPAFEVHATNGLTLPVVCEAYQYLPGDDKDELAEEAKVKLAAAFPAGSILVFKIMPYKTVGEHRYAFGGLLYWKEQWRPFALCDSMQSLDSLIEQREAEFSFNAPDPRYAEDLGLSRALSLMTSGYDPNKPRRIILMKHGDWVAEIPD